MTLTVADIERWDAGDVREVFHAATSRAQAARDAANGLATLPGFTDWGGETAEAAKEALGKTRTDLDAHGNEAQAVANAARSAADNIERIRSELATVKADAELLGMEIDPVSGRVVAGPGFKGDAMELLLKQEQLQPRVDKIVGEANLVDMALANAIHMADGSVPIPNTPIDKTALDKPLPEDPKQFEDMWNKLSKEQKDYLYSRDHNIGNHNGMPVGDDQIPGKDHYNRLNLADQLARAQPAQRQVDALKAAHPDWANGQNLPNPRQAGNDGRNRDAYQVWKTQLDDATNRAKYLPDLKAVYGALEGNPDRKLMLLDTDTGRQARAAIAVGDPDTADHVSVTAPGLNTTVHGAIGGMTDEAMNVRQEAGKQLDLLGRGNESVAAIAWIGYDPPQIPGPDDIGGSVTGGWEVSHDAVAKAGAHDLAGFYDGINATHQGPMDLTAIGHSYGSLTTGLALQEPGNHGVDNALFYGSPGIEASTPAQLGLQSGHVFAMETPDDPIRWTYDGKPLIHATELLPPPLGPLARTVVTEMDLSGAGQFGPNPATNPNFTHLETGAATVPDGRTFGAASGHSDYPRWDSTHNQLYTSGYNIAAVIAGTTPVVQK
ncbi:alpha/beta hydrolase [Candidatus Mycolicibacterium alkanivorans]|uniref:Alpha/beta hydrolase family protein n=1 Tax=Candidatus Mycolicibacterium alkanivorans TaxID=2954114 RepID=A0ABS9YWP1_9MYCO|nr:alpha/beta hydrolase [Candidatus Mycolicibacterium alkanivorans]MCI4675631.1 alpha/beta hydrolase family protein [Candidatus Mycolicibacterium alkanivorans]